MKTRILSAIVALAVLFAVISCGNIWVLKIAAAVISVIGLFELYRAFDYLSHRLLVGIGMITGALIPLLPSLSLIVTVLLIDLVLGAAVMLSRPGAVSFSDLTNLLFFQIYVPCSLACLVWVRQAEFGFYAIWLILGGAWLTDTFAYFTGRAFGKRKLCPHISPHKTVAGAIGGLVGTTAAALLYGLFLDQTMTVHYLPLLGLGLSLGLLAQIGDLTASWIKRERGIKDFGNLMPGHGGIMDRFDSILFTAPAVCLFLAHFTLFVK